MRNKDAVGDDQLRIVFMRPKDKDDGSGGGRAVIKVNDDKVGALAYGAFFIVDLKGGTHSLVASGGMPFLGKCELALRADAGRLVFIDVGPRISYMIAATVGSLVGGAAAAVAGTEVFSSAGEAVVVSAAETAVGSAAGGAAAGAIESHAGKCSGPFKLARIDDEDALARLDGMVLSR